MSGGVPVREQPATGRVGQDDRVCRSQTGSCQSFQPPNVVASTFLGGGGAPTTYGGASKQGRRTRTEERRVIPRNLEPELESSPAKVGCR